MYFPAFGSFWPERDPRRCTNVGCSLTWVVGKNDPHGILRCPPACKMVRARDVNDAAQASIVTAEEPVTVRTENAAFAVCDCVAA
ncbi:MAG TPA: hypothetical protein VJB97_00155 [Candidatus Paceibacterota bacterium]